MDLDHILLSEISQTEQDKYILYNITYMWNVKKKKQIFKKKRESKTVATRGSEGSGIEFRMFKGTNL